MVLKIRAISLGDLNSVIAIEKSCFSKPWEDDIFDTFACWDGEVPLIDRSAFMHVADMDGTIVGYVAWLIEKKTNEGHIMNLAVRAENRRQGVGKKLLLHSFRMLRAIESPRCCLEVRQSNSPARQLYESLKMKRSGECALYYGDEDAIIYTIEL